MKACRRCEVEQPPEAYHRDPRNGDGRVATCKECVYKSRAERRARETPEQRSDRMARQREYVRKYRNTEHAKAAAAARERRRVRPRVTEMSREQRLRRNARARLAWAVAHGLPVPIACQRCGGEGPLHGHHHNGYEPEHWLDVEWLCVVCHGVAHRH